MNIPRETGFFSNGAVLLIVSALCALASLSCAPTLSEDDYKKACGEVPAADLAAAPDKYAGFKMKCTGIVVVYTEKKQMTGESARLTVTDANVTLLLAVADPSGADSKRQKPFLVVAYFEREVNDALPNRTVTVYGEFAGFREYERNFKKEFLPWVNVRYCEVLR